MKIKVRIDNPNNLCFVEWQLDEDFFDRIVGFMNKLFFDQCDEQYRYLRSLRNKALLDDNEMPF